MWVFNWPFPVCSPYWASLHISILGFFSREYWDVFCQPFSWFFLWFVSVFPLFWVEIPLSLAGFANIFLQFVAFLLSLQWTLINSISYFLINIIKVVNVFKYIQHINVFKHSALSFSFLFLFCYQKKKRNFFPLKTWKSSIMLLNLNCLFFIFKFLIHLEFILCMGFPVG